MPAFNPANILVRGANWIGDAVMTLPALAALRRAYPQARLTVLTRPWAAAVYSGQAEQVLTQEVRGLTGTLALARRLAGFQFDLAVLFQNAFSAALLTALARIPERWGYARDWRGPLLTRAVKPRGPAAHEVFYYLNLLENLGLSAPYRPPRARFSPAVAPEELLAGLGAAPSLALAPGAAFGPAKRWPEADFARAARLILAERPGVAVILGGSGELDAARNLADLLPEPKLNLAGRTNLETAMAVLSRSALLLTNDSGLMHLGGALGVPLTAVFGPTDPAATAPLGPSRLLRSAAPCAPCLKRVCPLKRRICFDGLTPEKVAAAALELLTPPSGRPPAVFMSGLAPTAAQEEALARAGYLTLPETAEAARRRAEGAFDLHRSFLISGEAPAEGEEARGLRLILIPAGERRKPAGRRPAAALTAPDLRRAVEWLTADRERPDAS